MASVNPFHPDILSNVVPYLTVYEMRALVESLKKIHAVFQSETFLSVAAKKNWKVLLFASDKALSEAGFKKVKKLVADHKETIASIRYGDFRVLSSLGDRDVVIGTLRSGRYEHINGLFSQIGASLRMQREVAMAGMGHGFKNIAPSDAGFKNLEHVGEKLQDDKPFVIYALGQGESIKFVSERLQTDEDVALAAGLFLKPYLDRPLYGRSTYASLIPDAYRHPIPEVFRRDQEFLRKLFKLVPKLFHVSGYMDLHPNWKTKTVARMCLMKN